MTKLDIINAMLLVVGEQPVTSLTSTNPSVGNAEAALDALDESFQGRGWFFNTEFNVVLKTGSDGRVVIPSTALFIDCTDASKNYVQRGSTLYDVDNHTDQFTSDVSTTIIYRIDIDDLPPVAAYYLRCLAQNEFFTNEDGEGTKGKSLSTAVQKAWNSLNSQHIRWIGKNLRNNPSVLATMRLPNGNMRSTSGYGYES